MGKSSMHMRHSATVSDWEDKGVGSVASLIAMMTSASGNGEEAARGVGGKGVRSSFESAFSTNGVWFLEIV